jgi:hypothetical protein
MPLVDEFGGRDFIPWLDRFCYLPPHVVLTSCSIMVGPIMLQ